MSPLKHSNNFAARMGRWSASHWKTAVFGWLAFVVASFAIGMTVGTNYLKTSDANVGESARPTRSSRKGSSQGRRAGRDRLRPEQEARCPRPGLQGRHRGRHPHHRPLPAGLEDPFAAGSEPREPDLEGRPLGHGHVRPEGRLRQGVLYIDNITKAVDKVETRHPGFYVEEIGSVSTEKKFQAIFDSQLAKVGLIALLLTLVILLFVFGSAVAATRAAAAGAHRRHGNDPARRAPEPVHPGRRADLRGDPPDRARGRDRLLAVLPPPRA